MKSMKKNERVEDEKKGVRNEGRGDKEKRRKGDEVEEKIKMSNK
jgi:hypothetical protein